MTLQRAAAALLCIGALAACDERGPQDISGTDPGARVKFFNFGVNAPGVNFYANDAKITAIGSTTGTESTNGTASGSAGNGGFYSGIAPGQYTLTGKIAAATDKDLAVSTVATSVEAGKFYSYFISGIYNTTAKTVDAFVVEDPLPAQFDFSVAYVRFVNAVSNASPMTLYVKSTTAGSTEVAVGQAVAYKAGGAFVAVPGGVYDLNTRVTGSTANAISRAAVSFANGAVYTVTARGDITVTSTTAATRPQLDNTANR